MNQLMHYLAYFIESTYNQHINVLSAAYLGTSSSTSFKYIFLKGFDSQVGNFYIDNQRKKIRSERTTPISFGCTAVLHGCLVPQEEKQDQ